MLFGRPWRNRRWRTPAPMPRAATTKSRSRSVEQARAHHARQHGPGEQRDHPHRRPQPGAGDGSEHQQQNHRRQRHREIDEAHARRIGPAPAEGGDRAHQEAERERDADREERDQQRGAPALQQPRQHVAAHAVRAEQMPPARGRIARQQIDAVRAIAEPQRIARHQCEQQEDDGEPAERRAVAGRSAAAPVASVPLRAPSQATSTRGSMTA